ncbi:WD40 repeat domain-containing protein [Nocardia wallacei]|uniref:WD40 repeat domain-containing protein n=1 Tax=Nocardia wallacei TaxID=480035 RepID=UPI00245670DE|nr:WD40 repeat domain-containing protein [Nocardia wallacei]
MTGGGRDPGGVGEESGSAANRVVDARAAQGVQIGDHNTQVIYSYRGTWTDGVAPAPLIGVSGEVESPYRGLGWFSERDAPFFFGRDAAIDQVLHRLSRRVREPGIVLVSGVSGAGKSSLMRAGVIPRIRGQGLGGVPRAHAWPCLLLTPGHSPVDELAVATAHLAGLEAATVRREVRDDPTGFAVTAAHAARTLSAPESGDAGGLVLIIDQFEQVFTQCSDSAQRQAFVTALHAAATTRHADTTVLVVLVVRADFEADCGDYEQLTDAVQQHYFVTAMTERQLRLAITEPAKRAGSRVEDDLTEQLLREIRTRTTDSTARVTERSTAGVLPLLSYALDRTWHARRGDTLSVADYENAGGIDRAVADNAQRAYDSLTPPQRTVARRIFTRLTVPGADGADYADRLRRRDITGVGDPGDIAAVLEAFAAERLLTLGADTVEISHEVLLTTWPLLRDTWLAETRADRVVLARLRAAAEEWSRHGRDASYLYTGSVLEVATAAVDRATADPTRHAPLGDIDARFLAAAKAADRARVRRRRALVGLLAAMVVVLATTAVVALRASNESSRQRDIAVARQLIAQSELLAGTDPLGARLSALAAWRIDPGSKSESRLAMVTAARSPLIGRIDGGNPWNTPFADRPDRGALVSFSPDGRIMAVGNIYGVTLWDPAARRQIGDIVPVPLVTAMQFAPDGKTLAIGTVNGMALWDTQTRQAMTEPLTVPAGRGGEVASITFAPDGGTMAVESFGGMFTPWNNSVMLWEVRTRKYLTSLVDLGNVRSMAFTPDGASLITGGDTLRRWDVRTGKPLGDLIPGADTAAISAVAMAPDGKTLAVGRVSGLVQWWDVTRPQQVGGESSGHIGAVSAIAFTPDSRTLATGGSDDTTQLWDVTTGAKIGAPVTNHSGGVSSVAFSTDGGTLGAGGLDQKVTLWDVRSRRPIGDALHGHAGPVSSVAFAPDARTLATAGEDGTTRLWDTQRQRQNGDSLSGHEGAVSSVAFSPDATMLATTGHDSTTRLWNVRNRQQIDVLPDSSYSWLSSVSFDRGGGVLATGAHDGTVRLWDVQRRSRIGDPLRWDGSDTISSVAFSPNGGILAVGSVRGLVAFYDTSGHRSLGDPSPDISHPVSSVAFSPDGETLAAGGSDGTVRLWDTRKRTAPSQLGEQTRPVSSVAFSPLDETLAVASDDGIVRLWDTRTRRQIGDPLAGPAGGVTSVAFSPDGGTLAVGNKDGTVRLWDVRFTAEPEKHLCDWADGRFTRDEWNRYVPKEQKYQQLCP